MIIINLNILFGYEVPPTYKYLHINNQYIKKEAFQITDIIN